jgi:hypothetical protein
MKYIGTQILPRTRVEATLLCRSPPATVREPSPNLTELTPDNLQHGIARSPSCRSKA